MPRPPLLCTGSNTWYVVGIFYLVLVTYYMVSSWYLVVCIFYFLQCLVTTVLWATGQQGGAAQLLSAYQHLDGFMAAKHYRQNCDTKFMKANHILLAIALIIGKSDPKIFPALVGSRINSIGWPRPQVATSHFRSCLFKVSNHSISFSSFTHLGFRSSAVSCFTRRRGRDTMEIFFGFISAACDRRPGGR